MEPTSSPNEASKAELEALANDPNPIIARLARAGLAKLGPASPPPAEAARTVEATSPVADPVLTPKMPALALKAPQASQGEADPRAMIRRLAASHAVKAEPGEPTTRPIDPGSRIWEQVLTLPAAPASRVAELVRAIQSRFRDWNEVTKMTYEKYFNLVRSGDFSAELVAGLVKDACEPGVAKRARMLSKSLASEWDRQKPTAG